MLTYTVETEGERAKNYIGFARYSAVQTIPLRDSNLVETSLVSVYTTGELEIWVVQIGPSVDGFAELMNYYRDTYNWSVVRCHVIKLAGQGYQVQQEIRNLPMEW